MENLGTIGELGLAAPVSHDPRKEWQRSPAEPPPGSGSGGVVGVSTPDICWGGNALGSAELTVGARRQALAIVPGRL